MDWTHPPQTANLLARAQTRAEKESARESGIRGGERRPAARKRGRLALAPFFLRPLFGFLALDTTVRFSCFPRVFLHARRSETLGQKSGLSTSFLFFVFLYSFSVFPLSRPWFLSPCRPLRTLWPRWIVRGRAGRPSPTRRVPLLLDVLRRLMLKHPIAPFSPVWCSAHRQHGMGLSICLCSYSRTPGRSAALKRRRRGGKEHPQSPQRCLPKYFGPKRALRTSPKTTSRPH